MLCLCVYEPTDVHTCVFVCMYIHVYLYACIYMCICMYVCIHVYLYGMHTSSMYVCIFSLFVHSNKMEVVTSLPVIPAAQDSTTERVSPISDSPHPHWYHLVTPLDSNLHDWNFWINQIPLFPLSAHIVLVLIFEGHVFHDSQTWW